MLGVLLPVFVSAMWAVGSEPKAVPASPQAKIEAFLKSCEENRRGAILHLEHTLRGLRRRSPQSPDVVRRIAETEEALRALEAGELPMIPTIAFPPESGAIGRLPRTAVHVDQIVSDREMLVRCFFPVRVSTVRNFRAEGETVVQPVTFLVRGIATKDVHEGADLKLPQVFEISGRHTYTTVAGRRQNAWVLREFDLGAIGRFREGASKTPATGK